MFKRVGSTVVAHPWRVIAVWVVAAVAIVGLSPSLSDVTNADQTSFLPDDYPSVQAQEFAEEAFPEQSSGSSSIFVVTPEGGGPLTGAQVQAVSSFAEELQAAGIPRVQGVVTGPEQVAPEGEAQLVQVSLEGIASEEPVQEAVETLRDRADAAFEGSSLEVGLTGDAALLVDNQEAFSDAQSITLVATLGLILGLLLAIFRSPVAALMPLLSVGLVFATATSLVALLADGLGFEVGAESTSLLVVVLFGIGTDYILFLLFRYRERLRSGEAPKEAIRQAVGRVGRVIGSAALVVIVAFAALLLSELESFTTLAPSLFISVAVMLVAALTLIPAIVSLVGPRVFWPSKSWQQEPDGKLSKQIGGLIARRSGPTALASGGVLVALAVGVAFYQANYDTIDQLPGGTESAEAFEQLNDAFPAGASNPTNVYVRGDGGLQQGELRELRGALDEAADVAQVGEPQLAEAGDAAQIPVVLADSPFSNEALDAVKGPVREVADSSEAGTEVLVGGQTAAFADVRDAVNRDYTVVFPVAAALIALILGLLLRSLVAPLYLLGAVVLGFGATLGASVAVFSRGLGSELGLMFSLPILLYLFVVAIGTDYNILMVSRLREEAEEGKDPRTAADLAVEHAGPTVAAAGVILAGTFASLMLTGVSLLVQMGFAVSIGIVLAAFVMAAVFVPSVTALIGRRAWWPGRLDTGPGAEGPARTWPQEAVSLNDPEVPGEDGGGRPDRWSATSGGRFVPRGPREEEDE